MTLQNRVTPFGELVADPARGTMLGNRGGRFHDPVGRRLAGRRWAGKAWLVCVLERPGIRRDVWGRGYTELFFLDEVTALAAGHRPCAFCRRPAVRAFLGALAAARPGSGAPRSCPELDRRLHAERLGGRDRRRQAPAEALPDGAVVAVDGAAHAVRRGRLLAWSSAGWREAGPVPGGPLDILTPPTTVATLAGGYAPLWHASAD